MPPLHEAPGRPVLVDEAVLVQQREGGARRRRAAQRVADRVPAERRLDLVRLEALAEVLARRGRREIERLLQHPAVGERAATRAGEAGDVAHGADARVGRRLVQQRHDRAADGLHLRLEERQGLGVGAREVGDVVPVRSVVADHEPRAVGEDVERRPGRRHRQPARVESHVLAHRGSQHAQHVGAGRGAVAGRELLGHAGAADDRAALEHERAQARRRQVVGGDQAVVAAADHDHVLRGVRAHESLAAPALEGGSHGAVSNVVESPGSSKR